MAKKPQSNKASDGENNSTHSVFEEIYPFIKELNYKELKKIKKKKVFNPLESKKAFDQILNIPELTIKQISLAIKFFRQEFDALFLSKVKKERDQFVFVIKKIIFSGDPKGLSKKNLKKLNLLRNKQWFQNLDTIPLFIIDLLNIPQIHSETFYHENIENITPTDNIEWDRYQSCQYAIKTDFINIGLPKINTLEDLSYMLCVKPKDLEDILEKRKRRIMEYSEDDYIRFLIRKKTKNAGFRTIYAPKYKIKAIQKKIYIDILSRVEPSPVCYSFRKKYSIVDNATPHLNSKIVWNIDLENFFPSIKKKKVYWLFCDLGYTKKIALLLASICTYKKKENKNKRLEIMKNSPSFLPQGAITSPIISNLVCLKMDERLLTLAKSNSFVYTRYADDLTFSSKEMDFIPDSFKKQVFEILRDNYFKVNYHKQKIAKHYNRQIVTGVLVNNKNPTVPRQWLKKLRASLHTLEYGKLRGLDLTKKVHEIKGKLAYLSMINQTKFQNFHQEFVRITKKINYY